MNRSLLTPSILCILFSCPVVSFCADEDMQPFRYGVQTSLNSYQIDDPDGHTAGGGGLSISAIALIDVGRARRLMFNLNKDAYTLDPSTTNIGQQVSSIGGGLSYQFLLRLTRNWKPWVGAGLGYTSATYKTRYRLTPGGASLPLGERNDTDISFLLNANTEWQFNRDWDIGVQAQISRSINDDATTLRLGIYAVY